MSPLRYPGVHHALQGSSVFYKGLVEMFQLLMIVMRENELVWGECSSAWKEDTDAERLTDWLPVSMIDAR